MPINNNVRWRRKPNQNTNTASNKSGGLITYVMNDYTTPDLIKQVPPPVPSSVPVFTVSQYNGGGFVSTSPQGQAANCYVTITNTIKYINSMSEKRLSNWAATNNLIVKPRSGTDLNAFYDRYSLQFFYAKVGNRVIFTADSTDIVSHELGHAILDSYRPDLWSVAALEVWSFHEAFADITAMFHVMQYDEVLNYALRETGGDIHKSNVFSNLAEDMGRAMYEISKGRDGQLPNALRSAVNNFKYVDPGTLPPSAPRNKLAAECHSFGRIFLGAFYDILEMFYKDVLKTGKSQLDSIKAARDLLAKYVLKAIQNAPLNSRFYESVAKTMLWADWTNGKVYHDRMRNIFLNRNLIKTEIKMLNAPKCNNDNNIMIKGSVKELRLSDHVVRSLSNTNPLYDVVLEIPEADCYFYDDKKNVIDVVTVTKEDTLRAAVDMIEYLHKSRSVDGTEKTPFEIKEGKLVRTHFV